MGGMHQGESSACPIVHYYDVVRRQKLNIHCRGRGRSKVRVCFATSIMKVNFALITQWHMLFGDPMHFEQLLYPHRHKCKNPVFLLQF